MIAQTINFCRTWFLAVRPWAYSNSVSTVCFAGALSYHYLGRIDWLNFLITLCGVVCFHTAANLLNDCYDFKRGIDHEVKPNSGGIVRGLVSVRQVFVAALIFLVIGIAAGIYLTTVAGPVVLGLGLIGAFITVAYTTAGPCLKYMGLGDLAMFVAFGILPVFGTFWVQTMEFSWLPILWSFPPALLTVGILHANNWRDISTDVQKGCRTLAARIGAVWSARYYRLLVSLAFFLVLIIVAGTGDPTLKPTPTGALLLLLSLPYAVRLQISPRINGAQPDITLDVATAQLHLVFVILLTLGFLWK